ncbi:MAG: EF-hand domain-containing protein [Nitrosomonas sp.]|uniref:EF-hand domain-containing protein n=1 Tax=Nitrosomonas sp. TaxID=42353 RepID=UPI0032EB33B6
MRHKRNLVSIAVAAVFLLAGNATMVLAADATQSSSHQHQSGQAAGHSHGDAKSSDEHGHQCEHMGPVDTNKDGKISKEEFMKHHEAMFDKKDANKDGVIDQSEMHRMMDHMHKHGSTEQPKDSAHSH